MPFKTEISTTWAEVQERDLVKIRDVNWEIVTYPVLHPDGSIQVTMQSNGREITSKPGQLAADKSVTVLRAKVGVDQEKATMALDAVSAARAAAPAPRLVPEREAPAVVESESDPIPDDQAKAELALQLDTIAAFESGMEGYMSGVQGDLRCIEQLDQAVLTEQTARILAAVQPLITELVTFTERIGQLAIAEDPNAGPNAARALAGAGFEVQVIEQILAREELIKHLSERHGVKPVVKARGLTMLEHRNELSDQHFELHGEVGFNDKAGVEPHRHVAYDRPTPEGIKR